MLFANFEFQNYSWYFLCFFSKVFSASKIEPYVGCFPNRFPQGTRVRTAQTRNFEVCPPRFCAHTVHTWTERREMSLFQLSKTRESRSVGHFPSFRMIKKKEKNANFSLAFGGNVMLGSVHWFLTFAYKNPVRTVNVEIYLSQRRFLGAKMLHFFVASGYGNKKKFLKTPWSWARRGKDGFLKQNFWNNGFFSDAESVENKETVVPGAVLNENKTLKDIDKHFFDSKQRRKIGFILWRQN